MRIPFKALQKSDYFKDSEIIAGYGGLENQISSINMVDTPYDYERFQVAGAFVMLAGWDEHFDTPEKRATLLYTLDRIGVAGVGIYSYEFPDEYPDDLLSLANELNLPMITLKVEQNYIEVIKYFTDNLYIEFYQAFLPKEEIQEQLLRYYKGDKLNYLANKLWELCSNDIYIRFFDNEYNIRGIDIDRIVSQKDLWQMRPLEVSAKNVFQDFYTYQLSDEEDSIQWIGYHESGSNGLIKAFWMFIADEVLDEQNWKLYFYTFKALRLEFEKRDYNFIQESNAILAHLLSEKSDKTSLSNSARRLLDSISGTGRVLNFSIPLEENQFDPLFQLINNCLKENGVKYSQYFIGNFESHLVILLFADMEPAEWYRTGQQLLSDSILDIGIPESTCLGIGNAVEFSKLKYSNANALNAQFWAALASKPLILYEDMSVLRFLDSDNAYQEAMDVLSKYIQPLEEYDQENNAELIPTLRAFVTSLWNYSETSRVLYVHCNTVKYRIKQIKDILGVDWSDIQQRLNIEMAIMIHDFLHPDSTS